MLVYCVFVSVCVHICVVLIPVVYRWFNELLYIVSTNIVLVTMPTLGAFYRCEGLLVSGRTVMASIMTGESRAAHPASYNIGILCDFLHHSVFLCSYMPNHHSACENESVSMSALLVCSPSRAGTVEVDVGSLLSFF